MSDDLRIGVIGLGLRASLADAAHRPGDEVRVWNTGPSDYRPDADAVHRVPGADGSHGGADAAGELATRSLREGGLPFDVPPLEAELAAYFDAGQVRERG